jgi:hypothetical protein
VVDCVAAFRWGIVPSAGSVAAQKGYAKPAAPASLAKSQIKKTAPRTRAPRKRTTPKAASK